MGCIAQPTGSDLLVSQQGSNVPKNVSVRAVLAMTTYAFFCCLCDAAIAQTRSASAPTVEQIRQELEKQEAILFGPKGFFCRVHRTECEVITPSRYGNLYYDVEFVVARKGDHWLTQKAYINVDEEVVECPEGGKVYLPKKPTTSVMKDGLIFQWLEAKDVATVDPFGEGQNMHQSMDYLRQLGFDASKHLAHSAKADYSRIRKTQWLREYIDHPFLPAYLQENQSKYRILSEQQAVDGAACWVLEYPGMDKIWLDPARAYAVRRRIYHWGPGEPRRFEIVNSDFKEFLPGLWLPQAQVVEQYAKIAYEDRSIWDKPTCRLHYQLVAMEFGDIPDDLFCPDVLPGMTIYDGVRDIQYRIAAKGEDPFEGPIAAAQKFERMRRIAMFVVGLVFLVVIVFVALRKGRRHET